MSSMYSQPTRNDNMPGFEPIPLRDFNQVQETEWREKEEKKKKKHRKYKCSAYALGALVVLIAIPATVLGVVLGKSKELAQTPTNGTESTSIVTTTTSIPGKVSTSIQTLPPVTQTTAQTETEVSQITTEVTKSSFLTTTDTTSITVTPTKDPHDGKRCNINEQYGGQELHDINSDYDLLLVDAVQEAVGQGMDIGGASVLEVSERSVFLCSGSHSVELLEACESGFERGDDGIYCNSEGDYPIPSITSTNTRTSTSTSLTKRRRTATGYGS